MESQTGTPLREWRDNWTLVLAAFVGFSFAGIPPYAMTFFIDPLTSEFGWTRTQAAFGLSLFAVIGVPLSPFVGALVDSWGPRRLAITGLVSSTIMLGSLGFTTGSVELWSAQWVVFACAIIMLKTTVWTAAVGRVFDNGRGMAIAATLCGTAFAQTVVPLLAYQLIESVGWRWAFTAFATGWGGIALLLVLLFFRDGPRTRTLDEKTRETPASFGGMTTKEAARSLIVYRIAMALALVSVLSMTVIAHKVGILGEMDISRSHAAMIAATAGAAGISGKLLTGWLFDRSDSQWIGAVAFGLPAVGFVCMLEPIRTPFLIVLGMVFLGLGNGASMQVTVYLITRYVGMRNFGKVFGTVSMITVFGVGAGPVLGGLIVDTFGSFEPLIVGGSVVGLLASALVMGLGPYPDWGTGGRSSEPPPTIPSAA